MAHIVAWQEVALAVARELAVDETSPTKIEADRDWDARGDEINEEIRLALAGPPDGRGPAPVPDRPGRAARLPDGRARRRAGSRTPSTSEFFLDETIDHYEAHADDIAAVLASVGR